MGPEVHGFILGAELNRVTILTLSMNGRPQACLKKCKDDTTARGSN